MPLLLSLLQASYCKALGVCGRSQGSELLPWHSLGCGLLNFPLCLPGFKGLQASLRIFLSVPVCLLPKN